MATCAACGAPVPEKAGFCPACGAPVAAGLDQSERKLATVIFADLVGSTQLAGSLDPERTRAMLDRFYDAMAAEIQSAGGTVEKFAGDAVMAVFGAPASLEDHAERALHAALALLRRLHELFGETLELRIGVNTGEVVVGKPREGSSFVTGDPVNVAARLEQAAEPGEILVGERTVATARGAFEFGEHRTIEAKGKPEGVECRRLVRGLSLMRPRGVGGLRRAFVGRAEEMEVLERVYEEVEHRREPRLVTVLGDAGVGKTRLLREFWDRLGERSPETLRRTGRCLSYGQGITYWPLAEVLKEHLGIFESDPPATVLERLGSREMLGLTLGLDVAHGLHPLAARDRFQDAWVGFLEEIVAERPTVVLIEDIHWGEEQLLDLLERLVGDTRGLLLLIATARPELLEQRPGWGARVRATTLELEALSSEDAVRMLDELLGGTLPVGLREVVVQRAEGNPFFVEELLGTLIDRRLLELQNGSWRLAQLPSDFTVPDTVQAVVAARVDLLDPPEKQALQAASVIGRVFWAGPVYELVEEAEPDLRILEERDFIRRRPGSSIAGDREYAIKHALTREVAYAGLPKARRARLHAAFARWLERTGEGRDEYAPLLAHHYAEAVRPDDSDLAWAGEEGQLAELRASALAWLRSAAERAIGRFEIDEGLALLHRALDLEPDESGRAVLWREVGRANVFKLDGEAFWTAMLNSLAGTTDRATVADTYSILAFHTATRASMWKRRPDRELIAGWIDRALELSEPDAPARARALIARTNFDPERFGAAAQEASELADRIDDMELRSWAWDALCMWALSRGDYEEAYAWARRCLDIAPRLTDPDHVALIYVFALPACLATGRFEEARRISKAHDEVTANLTPHHRLHAANLLIDVEQAAGCWDVVRHLTSRAESAVAANLATPCASNVSSLLTCALANVHLGNEEESRRLERSAEDLGMEGYSFDALYVEIAIARGDLGEVERRLSEWRPERFLDVEDSIARLNALVALERRAEIEEEAPAMLQPKTYLEPFALRALGYARADHGLIQQAVERFEAMGLDWHAAKTRSLMSPE
ncbi:MAG: AAA family ATPase [Actinomycetota bacterium]|nr:AAA family ATPase [Actinomycetota bacterium]